MHLIDLPLSFDELVAVVRRTAGLEPGIDEWLVCTPGLARVVSRRGETLLHHAAEAGNVEAVRQLLEHGADVNAPNRHGTPLMWAATWGHVAASRVLLAHGANLAADSGADLSALGRAVRFGHAPLLQCLLEHGANPHEEILPGYSALACALETEDEEGATLLRRHGAVEPPRRHRWGHGHVRGRRVPLAAWGVSSVG